MLTKGDYAVLIVFIISILVVGPMAHKAAVVNENKMRAERAAKAVQMRAERAAKAVPVANKTIQAEANVKRFSAEFHGEFRGGYDNNIRHIFIITDSETETKYLAITGCGVSELRTESDGKSYITKEE